MSSSNGPGIFISYSSQDRFIATMVAQHLREIGYRPWVDFGGISGGDEWLQRIHDALDQSHACLVLLTPESASSEWVHYEIARAQSLDRPVIPLLFRTCELPSELEALHYLDFRDDVDGSFKGLQRALTTALWRTASVHDEAEIPPVRATPPPPAPTAHPTPPPGASSPTAPGSYSAGPGTYSVIPIEKNLPVERIIVTGLGQDEALESARRYLLRAGYRQKRRGPEIVYIRGSDWLALVVQTPRNVRRTFTLLPLESSYSPHTQIRVMFEVFCPPGWTINNMERAFWRAEIREMETALLTGDISHRESNEAEKELMPRVWMVTIGTVVLLIVLIALVFGILDLMTSSPTYY